MPPRTANTPPLPSTDCGPEDGFTLVELLVTVIIAAILATIAIPYLTGRKPEVLAHRTEQTLTQAMALAQNDFENHASFEQFSPTEEKTVAFKRIKWEVAAGPWVATEKRMEQVLVPERKVNEIAVCGTDGEYAVCLYAKGKTQEWGASTVNTTKALEHAKGTPAEAAKQYSEDAERYAHTTKT